MTLAFEVQLEGSIQFCTVDATGVPATGAMVEYGAEIGSLVVSRTRNAVVRKPTFADARSISRAADLVETVAINFLGDEGNAAGFHSLLWTALSTPPCELYFTARMKPGVVGPTNPSFSGYMVAMSLDSGGTPGAEKWQSKTFPAHNVTKAVS